MTSTLRFLRPSAIQIAEYRDWDRALPVTAVPGLASTPRSPTASGIRCAGCCRRPPAARSPSSHSTPSADPSIRRQDTTPPGASCNAWKTTTSPRQAMTAPRASRCSRIRRTGDTGRRGAGARRRCYPRRPGSRPCSWARKSSKTSSGATTRETIPAISSGGTASKPTARWRIISASCGTSSR